MRSRLNLTENILEGYNCDINILTNDSESKKMKKTAQFHLNTITIDSSNFGIEEWIIFCPLAKFGFNCETNIIVN